MLSWVNEFKSSPLKSPLDINSTHIYFFSSSSSSSSSSRSRTPHWAGIRVSQTTAIINCIARKAGTKLEGTPGDQFAVSQMLIAQSEDMYSGMQKVVATKFVPQSKKGGMEAFDHFWANVIPAQFQKLETLLGGGSDAPNAGKGMWKPAETAGELYMFATLHQMVLVNPKCLDATPRVSKFYQGLLGDARVKRVLSGASPFGEIGQYFMNPPRETERFGFAAFVAVTAVCFLARA
jgi:hypothetical protein